ncbi:hypothetical protein JCM33374_g5150 [Metschnikowia sp. JCM 33374]|nr:hypothetical protein JCM33374_g5150 [Metschnikowia sp. JCM 33374]
MALGICTICSINPAKYKCPKCAVPYCSLPCFKSEKHTHDEAKDPHQLSTPLNESKILPTPEIATISETATATALKETETPPSLFERIANDSVIRSLLSYKSLQVHLSILLKLLSDSSLTREPIFENRKEIVNMRLCDLRIGGAEENELVEEFVQRVLYLHDENNKQE